MADPPASDPRDADHNDPDVVGPEVSDPGLAALAAAKRAALEKVDQANRTRRAAESTRAAVTRREGTRRKRGGGGDRTDWDEPTTLGSAVADLLSTRGWEGELAVATVLGDWASLVGLEIADKATPQSLRDGELVVVAESTAWATQLRLLAPQLVAAITDRLGPGVVSKIVARGPSGPPTTPGQWKVRGGRGPRDTYG